MSLPEEMGRHLDRDAEWLLLRWRRLSGSRPASLPDIASLPSLRRRDHTFDTHQRQSFEDSLVQQESHGNYHAIGALTAYGRALGRYQIVPYFHFEKIGLNAHSAVDRKRFLDHPELQDQLFHLILNDLDRTYHGNRQRMAAAYYGGQHGAAVVGTGAGDTPQTTGPSVNGYVDSVLARTEAKR